LRSACRFFTLAAFALALPVLPVLLSLLLVADSYL
jgi:hypothetical protein